MNSVITAFLLTTLAGLSTGRAGGEGRKLEHYSGVFWRNAGDRSH